MTNTTDTNYYELNTKIPNRLQNIILDKIKKFQSRTEFNSNSHIDDHIHFTDDEKSLFDAWLKQNNLPNMHYAVLFFKKDITELENDHIHIDYNADYNEISLAAINIPVVNFENTIMSWWSGDYSYKIKFVNEDLEISNIKTEKHFIPFASLTWHNKPELIDTYNLNGKPFLAKVDIPHSVTACDTRIVFSLRLENNPHFNELKKILSEGKKNVI